MQHISTLFYSLNTYSIPQQMLITHPVDVTWLRPREMKIQLKGTVLLKGRIVNWNPCGLSFLMVLTTQQAKLSIRFSGKGLNSPAPTPLMESAITHTVHRDVCLLLVIVIQPPPALYTTEKGALLFQILEIFLRCSHYVALTGLKLRSACLYLPIAETTSMCSKSFLNL